MSGMRMFPPIMRDRDKRSFNAYSVGRCVEELNRTDIGTVVGIHPEGTRNKGDDPYTFLPAQPGVGRIALAATRAHVIPVFVLGMGQSIAGEWRMNALSPEQHPVDVHFGPPIDFSDLRPKAQMPTAQKRAADRCLDAIKVLADAQRRTHAIRSGVDPSSVPVVVKSDDAFRTAKAKAAAQTLAGEDRVRG
jgi:1-acyl-sn-glycerol-3-phosphate acyltransferase